MPDLENKIIQHNQRVVGILPCNGAAAAVNIAYSRTLLAVNILPPPGRCFRRLNEVLTPSDHGKGYW
jgi:hypothetical protein